MPLNTEMLAVVSRDGVLQRLARRDEVDRGSIVATELVLICLPEKRSVVLLERGLEASDMQHHLSLQAGKVCEHDLLAKDAVGKKLSVESFRKAAVREMREELGWEVRPERLKVLDTFFMELGHKRLYFTLFSLEASPDEVNDLGPAQIRLLTPEEFAIHPRLGDAIECRKQLIADRMRRVLDGKAVP